MNPCDSLFIDFLLFYFAGFILGWGATILGFRSYYKDLYRVKR